MIPLNDFIYQFEVEISGDVISGESYPIYDYNNEKETLLGGFSLVSGDKIIGFVSGKNYPAALMVSSDSPFYFTPKDNYQGKVSHGVLSEYSISPLSIKISKTTKEVVCPAIK